MYGLLKLLYHAIITGRDLLNVNKNALQYVPNPSKYFAMIMLACFWCLAFGIYMGELLFIGYNMIGHIVILLMCFVTWLTFKNYTRTLKVRKNINFLRMPDRSSRCDELSDEERTQLAFTLNNIKTHQDLPK